MSNNNWLNALKEFNKDMPRFCLPRKGTQDYKYVKQLQLKLDMKQEQKTNVAPKKKAPTPKKRNQKSEQDQLQKEFDRLFPYPKKKLLEV